MAIDVHGQQLTPSNHEAALQGLWSQWVALKRMCVVPVQADAINCLGLCCELYPFLSLNEDTTLLYVLLWNV